MIRYYLLTDEGYINGSFACQQSFSTMELEEDLVSLLKKPRIVDGELVEGKTIEEETAEKIVKLKEIRNNLLFVTVTEIQQQFKCEQDAMELLGSTSGKITEDKYKEWLIYWQLLRDLPENINIDDYTLENIETAFPQQPE